MSTLKLYIYIYEQYNFKTAYYNILKSKHIVSIKKIEYQQ